MITDYDTQSWNRQPMKNFWDAKVYSQFLEERTRPAKDLLAAIPHFFNPNQIYDLGCGPGNSTILLKERWPQANVVGIDSSPDMLKEAKACYPDLHFIEEDIAHFSPTEKIDLIFASASLQWLKKHEILIPKLFRFLNIGSVFGIQMPNNFHAPSHQITVRLLQSHSDWQPFLKNLFYGILTKPLFELPWYYDLLASTGAKNLQLWQTEYFHEFPDYQKIFDWIKGTGLRPVLQAMDPANQTQFASAYIEAIAKDYPFQANHKILLPFKRIFMIGFN